MIDFHTHILPGIDDGSKDADESLKMLKMLSSQGVDTVIATSHFDPDKETVSEFIVRRQESYDKLLLKSSGDIPHIILGAEVIYYDGISNLENLEKLCIGDTGLLLLEMPMRKWSQYALKELKNLSCIKGFTIILAHIERYMGFQSPEVLSKIREYGILYQVNASFFKGRFTRRKALSMFRAGEIHAIGSDCHNLDTRPPQIGSAFEFIKSKVGEKILQDFTEYTYSLLYED